VAERRGPHREEHLRLVREAHAEGRILIAGAFGDPPAGAAIAFRSREDAEAFVAADPYVANGLVVRRRIEPYAVVAG